MWKFVHFIRPFSHLCRTALLLTFSFILPTRLWQMTVPGILKKAVNTRDYYYQMICTIYSYSHVEYDYWGVTSLAHFVVMNQMHVNKCTFIAALCVLFAGVQLVPVIVNFTYTRPDCPSANIWIPLGSITYRQTVGNIWCAVQRHILTWQIFFVCIVCSDQMHKWGHTFERKL